MSLTIPLWDFLIVAKPLTHLILVPLASARFYRRCRWPRAGPPIWSSYKNDSIPAWEYFRLDRTIECLEHFIEMGGWIVHQQMFVVSNLLFFGYFGFELLLSRLLLLILLFLLFNWLAIVMEHMSIDSNKNFSADEALGSFLIHLFV